MTDNYIYCEYTVTVPTVVGGVDMPCPELLDETNKVAVKAWYWAVNTAENLIRDRYKLKRERAADVTKLQTLALVLSSQGMAPTFWENAAREAAQKMLDAEHEKRLRARGVMS